MVLHDFFHHSAIISCITFHIWKSVDSETFNKVYRGILRFLSVHRNTRFIEGWTVLTETIVIFGKKPTTLLENLFYWLGNKKGCKHECFLLNCMISNEMQSQLKKVIFHFLWDCCKTVWNLMYCMILIFKNSIDFFFYGPWYHSQYELNCRLSINIL